MNSGEIKWEIKKIKPAIGMVSLVAVSGKDFPLSYGNYFSFSSGHYCLNMWAENLIEWLKLNPAEEIEVLEIIDDKTFCVVIDENIPKEWVNSQMCYTGCFGISEGLIHIANVGRNRG